MSPPDTRELLEENCREHVSHYICARCASSYSGRLHLPDSEAGPDDPHPLCGQTLHTAGGEWVKKRTTVYPPGFRPICDNCLEEFSESI